VKKYSIPKIDAIVQARLGSIRLPNKILYPVAGKPLLGHVIDRLKECHRIDRIIIATTENREDEKIERFCEAENIHCFRGSSDNVLDRFLGACDKFNCDRLLRVCSDNPFLDPSLMTKQIESFKPEHDYCSYYTKHSEPAIIKPVGFFVEAVTKHALMKSAELGKSDPRVQEHVTFLIHSQPDQFNIKKLLMPDYIDSEFRFTIDYKDDLKVCEEIIKNIKKFTSMEIMKYVDNNPSIYTKIRKQALEFPKIYNVSDPI
jgi:spore coat polysaccharide biosynthesis protein SpsF